MAHARRLLGLREGRDILPPELAELVGVTVNAVYAWEAGTLPGRANLERLADTLGVTPAWLHYGVEDQPVVRVVAEPEPVAKPTAKAVKRRRAT